MLGMIIRVALNALAFAFVFQKIPGVHFTGNIFPDAVVYAVLFAVVGWFATVLIEVVFAIFAIGTLGLGLLFEWPVQIFVQWVLPAVVLIACAHLFPENLAITSWLGAFLAGLVLMFINLVTRGRKSS